MNIYIISLVPQLINWHMFREENTVIHKITGFIEVCMEKTSVAVPKIKKTGEFCLS